METSKELQERELRLGFANLSQQLSEWGKAVDEKICHILQNIGNFDYLDVKIKPEYRLKNVDSFIKKALYRQASGKNYVDPLKQIEDKVGTRIVVLLSQHMSQVKDILMSQTDFWECSVGRDKALIKETIKEFDYEAVHLIVKPKSGFSGISDDIIPYLTCEIQIKTLFQHAYSEVSHDTVYKGPYRHDLVLLRRLARSMALIESTDETFNSMYSYISSGDGLALNFMQELALQFKKVNPEYNARSADIDLDSYVLDELMRTNVLNELDMEDISSFVEAEKKKLIRINRKENFLIGKHPVMLILGYLLKYSPEYLLGNDFDINMLQSLALQLNISYEPTR